MLSYDNGDVVDLFLAFVSFTLKAMPLCLFLPCVTTAHYGLHGNENAVRA